MSKDDRGREDREDLLGQVRKLRRIVREQQTEIARLQKYQKIVRHESKGNPKPPKEVEKKCSECSGPNVKLTVLELRGSTKKYWFCYDCGMKTKVH